MAVAAWMRSFDRNELPISLNALALIRDDFSSVSSSDDDIADEIGFGVKDTIENKLRVMKWAQD